MASRRHGRIVQAVVAVVRRNMVLIITIVLFSKIQDLSCL
jgi:hypothetical protein